ncbi:uncharacterized protein LOC109203502, partial [Oreochromis niloticus]|uniref:uncharacterized protein LOC109203502 n=1 Tax=Oreochromis niloticus TaxID=8128 RepID=UPI000DF2DCF4
MLSLDYYALSLLILTILTGVSCEDLTPTNKEVFSVEGSTVTLSYRYSKKATGSDHFYWYRQYPGKPPEFLLYHLGSGSVMKEEISGLSVQVVDDQKQIDLNISSAAVTDSAVYYCTFQRQAEKNSSTGFKNGEYGGRMALGSMNSIKQERAEEAVAEEGNINLTCTYDGSIYNIQWYRQYQRCRPEFLLSITEGGSVHEAVSGFSAHIDKTEKRVDLEISSAAVTDSAVYYCALQPTVTGNTKTLYKNLWS